MPCCSGEFLTMDLTQQVLDYRLESSRGRGCGGVLWLPSAGLPLGGWSAGWLASGGWSEGWRVWGWAGWRGLGGVVVVVLRGGERARMSLALGIAR